MHSKTMLLPLLWVFVYDMLFRGGYLRPSYGKENVS